VSGYTQCIPTGLEPILDTADSLSSDLCARRKKAHSHKRCGGYVIDYVVLSNVSRHSPDHFTG
jgi:hypothetical protein